MRVVEQTSPAVLVAMTSACLWGIFVNVGSSRQMSNAIQSYGTPAVKNRAFWLSQNSIATLTLHGPIFNEQRLLCWTLQAGSCFVVGTAHHLVRLFDVRAHRRPVLQVDFGESRITALQPEPDGGSCYNVPFLQCCWRGF